MKIPFHINYVNGHWEGWFTPTEHRSEVRLLKPLAKLEAFARRSGMSITYDKPKAETLAVCSQCGTMTAIYHETEDHHFLCTKCYQGENQ